MLPYITVFGASFSSYSITAGIGFFAMWLAAWLATRRQNDIDQNHIPHIAVTAMAGLFLGAHLLFGIVNIRPLFLAIADGFSQLPSLLSVMFFLGRIFGGMVFYGGLFGAIIGAYIYLKYVQLPFAPYYDVMAFCIPLFHGFARIGCFLGGCCYGVESECGIVYHNALEEAANGVSRFPVQLLESGLEFTLFAVILVLYKRKKCGGKLMYVYLLSYAVIRFFDEFLRGDELRGFVGPLSTSQFISVLMFVTVIILLINKAMKGRKEPVPMSVSEKKPMEEAAIPADE